MSEDMFSKMCNVCGFQPAMLFFRIFDGNSIGEEGLCPQCALKKFSENKGNHLEVANTEILNTINEMCSILTDIATHLTKINEDHHTKDLISSKCQACGYLFTDFIESHELGCSFCYTEFQSKIKNLIYKFNFNPKHNGHIPIRYRQQHIANIELEKLKLKLHMLLRKEQYEEAAKISKRIAKLEATKINNI